MPLPTPMAGSLPPQLDPHHESRERAERLLASVERELRENPSPTSHVAAPNTAPISPIRTTPGLRA